MPRRGRAFLTGVAELRTGRHRPASLGFVCLLHDERSDPERRAPLSAGLGARRQGLVLPPLYPVWVALIRPLVVDSVHAAAVVNALAGLAISAIGYRMLRHSVPPVAALLAIVGIAHVRLVSYYTVRTLSESLFVATSMFAIWLLMRAVERPTVTRALALGVAIERSSKKSKRESAVRTVDGSREGRSHGCSQMRVSCMAQWGAVAATRDRLGRWSPSATSARIRSFTWSTSPGT
ncbi:MAG: hypothetical protein CL908_03385 [Deltaproteobacteria bacterium]|nr:hypothetical protein [Deltaproteobacteria bacterium]